MKIARPRTERWHNYHEGDCGKPIDRDGSNKAYFKKGFWKRYDRKKFFRNAQERCPHCGTIYTSLGECNCSNND